jgi:hypothetical protein
MSQTTKPTPEQVAAGEARSGGGAVVTTPKKKKTKTTTQLVDKASKEVIGTNPPPGGKSGTSGLDGRPIGSDIIIGTQLAPQGVPGTVRKKTQYFRGSGAMAWSNLKNPERAKWLGIISQIPGAYGKNEAYTAEQIRTLGSSQFMIPIRPEDNAALERVMLYADTVGIDWQNAANYLISNPTVARTFLSTSELNKPAKAKKVVLTPAPILALELDQSFQDYLDTKADKKLLKDYVDKVNGLEIKRGGRLLDVERNNIMLDLIQTKAQEIFKGDQTPDSMIMQRGALGGAFNTLRKVYNDYGVVVDNNTIYKQAIGSVRSRQALENTIQKIQLQAQVSFPALEKYFAQGLTTREAMANHIGLYSKIYNVPEASINLDKIYPALKDGKIMSPDEWENYLYSLPEYRNTDLYKQRASNDAQIMMRNFFGGI